MTRRRLVMAALLAFPALAVAHNPPSPAIREIVRLKGQRRADGAAPAGRMQLVALGSEHPFAASERDAYSLTAEDAAKPADRYTLQGPRLLLARFAAARPEQTIVILAEHRPGSADLFVLKLDLCPE